jgi:hypothetical protein
MIFCERAGRIFVVRVFAVYGIFSCFKQGFSDLACLALVGTTRLTTRHLYEHRHFRHGHLCMALSL